MRSINFWLSALMTLLSVHPFAGVLPVKVPSEPGFGAAFYGAANFADLNDQQENANQAPPTLANAPTLAIKNKHDARPNLIFLLTDDQATISMGCYGNPDAKTPSLDRLANDGLVFDRHYVTTAICMASRASIMTGLYEYRTGCNFGYGKLPAKLWTQSFPKQLKRAGYRTAFAGKFGFEIEGRDSLPAEDFDSWGGGPGQTHYESIKNDSIKQYAQDFPHSTLAYAEFSKDFIRESVQTGQPFCLAVSFKAPHRPVTPDPQFNHIYDQTVFEKPENFGRENGHHLAWQSKTGRQFPRFEGWGYASDYDSAMRKYHQQVYAVDVAVGKIRAEIEAQGIAANTVIVFTSDNGFMCGSHGYGSKVIPYEESARVPLIVFDPRHSISGKRRRCDSLTGSIDLMPTLLSLAGVAVPENIDGVSLLPLLDDPVKEVRKSLSLMNFWGPDTTHSFGIVTNQWKYIYWYSHDENRTATEELFDMQYDRSELVNSATDEKYQAELVRMRAIYDQQVYGIKTNAIDVEYAKYGDLFDRTVPWSQKEKIRDK